MATRTSTRQPLKSVKTTRKPVVRPLAQSAGRGADKLRAADVHPLDFKEGPAKASLGRTTHGRTSETESVLMALKSAVRDVLVQQDAAHFRGRRGSALFLAVAEDFAEMARKPDPVAELPATAEAGWERLLEEGLRYKTQLLRSKPFISVAEAAPLLDLQEPAVRRRIRDHTLLALKHPSSDEHRIPLWALGLKPADTRALIGAVGDDIWLLWQFLTTPNGNLRGLRPFEVLLAPEHLAPAQRAARQELQATMESARPSPISIVIAALASEMSHDA